LAEAFARICCRCGLSYRFVPEDEGWRLELTDVERPDHSPEPIHSSYKKEAARRPARFDDAGGGRPHSGHLGIRDDLFGRARIMRNALGTHLHVEVGR